ncbi:MAG TPA: Ig-like domain-containing protein, partial [Gemmatimonadaceae bacterium]
ALTPASATLVTGDTVQFAADPRDDVAHTISGRDVRWTIANPAIAMITPGGALVGIAAGATFVVATVDEVSDSARITVSSRPVASVSVLPQDVTVTRGNSATLSLKVLDDRGQTIEGTTATWTSDNESVATVSSTGKVSAAGEGSATITATVNGANGNKYGKSKVKVVTTTPPIASITVTPASSQLVTATTLQLTATPRDASGAVLGGRTITWTSSNASVASVSASGLVTASTPGNTTIRAASEGQSGTAAITVTVPPVASVTVSPSSATVLVGKTVALSATSRDASGTVLTGRTTTWSTSKSSIATVSSSGVVTGVAAGSARIFATSEGKKDSATVTVTVPAVASIDLAPSSATLDVGATRAFTVTLKDASGAILTGRVVTWVTSDEAVSTVSNAGLVTAVGAGSATITAASEGKSAKATVTVSAPAESGPSDPTPDDPTPSDPTSGDPHSGYFVSPSGSASASGSAASPWSLSTALSGGNGRIQPGDTVWLRGGTYSGEFNTSLAGTASAPIIVREYPGERTTINGSLSTTGKYTWFWGFEVANTDAGSQSTAGVASKCTGCRFINLVIHDHSSNGLQMWSEGPDQEAYGNIIYNNGFYGQSADHAAHGIYAQNRTGTQKILDNLIFNQFGYGIHIYGSSSAALNNYTIDGNTSVNSGIGEQSGMSGGMDYQVGGEVPLENLVFTHNNSYRSPGLRSDNTARLGYNWGPLNYGGIITDNYFVGQLLMVQWGSVTFERNSVLDGAMPSQTRVVVQPSKYEKGRANVIIYNWGHQGAVSVDLSKVLSSGDSYEVRNAQNFYASPVASGTYGGGSVSIPITSITPPASISSKGKPVPTGTEFNAYVVVKK